MPEGRRIEVDEIKLNETIKKRSSNGFAFFVQLFYEQTLVTPLERQRLDGGLWCGAPNLNRSYTISPIRVAEVQRTMRTCT